jgi:integrator complex subunit 3
VKFGSHKRYQEWFQRQYLLTPESQSLRCDLIRFIVGVIHPTNELLCSDIIPRWAVIGWLLTTCTSQVAASNAKLALFYDWLYFEPEKDNIMNIEPAILVMHHSIKPHPAITATLLDFLCRIITNFCPREQDKVKNGIYSSLKQILEKRVLPSLSPLFDNPKMDKELKLLLRERFAPFVDFSQGSRNDNKNSNDNDVDVILESPADLGHEPADDFAGCTAQFSDDEAEPVSTSSDPVTTNPNEVVKATGSSENSKKASSSTASSKKKTNSIKKEEKEKKQASSPAKAPRKRPIKHDVESNDVDANLGDHVNQLLSELRSSSGRGDESMRTEEEEQCEVMDQLIQVIISEDFNYEQCNGLAQRLSDILRASFEGRIYPESSRRDEEALEDSVGKPLFVAFRALCDMVDSDGSGILLQVLAELYALQPRVGYYLLYFLSVDKQAKQRDVRTKAAVYKELCETIDSNYCLDICLVNDMRQCQEDDVQLFVHLIADVYSIFPKTAVGNVNLLYLVVSCVDGHHIQQLVCHILAKDLILFKKDSFSSIVTGSLAWETFEQVALWQLIGAHDVPPDCMYSILPKLNYEKHAEALTATLLRLRCERPNADVVRHVLSREPVKGDKFVSTLLNHWLFDYEDKLAELVSSCLQKQTSNSSSSSSSEKGSVKRKRGSANSHSNSMSRKAEITLTHLDNLRQNCRQYEFFSHPNLQKALRTSRQLCSDDQKKKFMDLFALAETDSDGDDDDDEVTINSKSRKNNAKSKAPRSRKAIPDDDDSESESSATEDSEDEDTKPLSVSSRSKSKQSKSTTQGKGSSSSGSNSRKRPAPSKSKNSLADSSENSSDEESVAVAAAAKKKKRRKKAAQSDSD